VNPGTMNHRIYIMALLALSACERVSQAEQSVGPPAAAPSVSASPQAKAPVCIHERCSERPSYIRCTDNYRSHYCDNYRVVYEHHCECDTWAP